MSKYDTYAWACRVIESCTTYMQVLNAGKLISLYYIKYPEEGQILDILADLYRRKKNELLGAIKF